ncbi:MAG TPA: hypothetical protein PK640_12670 [Verrucomicrobiota bacterium]|nr:hypothetical protein [Verrucomicrobiota bacterium]
MPGDPRVFAVQGKDLAGENLKHPRAKRGIGAIAFERGEGAQHGVLDGVGGVLRLPDQSAAIEFEVALDRLEQRQEAVRIGCEVGFHRVLPFRESRIASVLLRQSPISSGGRRERGY